jgi:hypothetical protein
LIKARLEKKKGAEAAGFGPFQVVVRRRNNRMAEREERRNPPRQSLIAYQ